MESHKLKIGVSVAIAIGCAGVAFAYYKFKRRLEDAVHLFNYIKIETINSENKCDAVIDELRKRSAVHKAVGFDCEWVSEQGRRHPVALVQLSSLDGLCGLFRLNQLKEIPASLKDLLEDEHIYKVGVGPLDDAKYLQNDYGVTLRSTLDIRYIAQLARYHPGGLANLAKSQLNCILDKSWRIRCSDWEAETLTERQSNYAAIDAHVAIKIFVKLINELNKSSVFQWFKKNNSMLNSMNDICFKYADIGFKTKHVSSSEPKSKSSKTSKTSLFQSKRYMTRLKPLYDNCFLEAPDGDLLCTCDDKKAKWYIEKELGDLVSENPMTVRLRFEPAGRSVGEVGQYSRHTKENKCVVCGATNSYIRKNVVPREYRKLFPEIVKEHSSHDVVLLCVRCHQTSNIKDQAVRLHLAKLCNAPLASGDAKLIEDPVGKKVRSAARALFIQSKKHVLPEERRKDLESILLEHYNVEEITEELLEEAAGTPVVFDNPEYESHGLKVVDYFTRSEGGLLKLEEMWREHFLSCMKPKYMPEFWSINHNEQRLRVKLDEGRLSEDEVKLLGLTKWL